MLAEVPDVRDDGRTYRYTLRAVHWHDGSRVHARHVAEAFENLRHAVSPWITYEPYTLVDDISILSSEVFDVRLRRRSPNFARTFLSPYGKPALPLLRHGSDGTPIGTGPFRFVRTSGGRVGLAAWAGSPRGTPASSSLDVHLISSAITLGVELASGEIDLALPIIRGLPAADRYRIVSRHAGTIVLLFNCSAAFRTPALRRAVLRALDVDILQRAIDPQLNVRVEGVLPPGDPDDVAFPFPERDAARARSELSEVRAPVTIAYVAEIKRYAQMALFIAAQLEAVGLTTNILPRAQAMYQGPLGPLRTGGFDLAVSGLSYTESPDLAADWGCSNRPPHGGNYARFCDMRFERAAEHGPIRRALRVLVDDLPFIPLARNVESFGIGPNTTGFAIPPPFVPPTIGAQHWARVDSR
jgi:ABC-type transport system substrate-binding protein